MTERILVFIFSIFYFSSLLVSDAKAQSISQNSSPTPQASVSADYNLPYPGILPDHPLYKLKVLRDKVTTFLIRDPIKKAEYHLLLADKRIYMSRLLVDKGKIALAKETALKGENEYTLHLTIYFSHRY